MYQMTTEETDAWAYKHDDKPFFRRQYAGKVDAKLYKAARDMAVFSHRQGHGSYTQSAHSVKCQCVYDSLEGGQGLKRNPYTIDCDGQLGVMLCDAHFDIYVRFVESEREKEQKEATLKAFQDIALGLKALVREKDHERIIEQGDLSKSQEEDCLSILARAFPKKEETKS
jgi:hypothetical protein